MISFADKIITVVQKIPKGKTLSYKEVAKRAGHPRAYRAVGTILKTYNPQKYKIPCHRVIKADGFPGEYRWGKDKKIELLTKEKAL